jgi:spermidine synthase
LKKILFLTPLTGAILAIYFFSGACSLTYEIIWQRLLKLILGNTTYATSITVAVFMGGLAFGAFLVRKKADTIKNKLLVYGIIELSVAFFALLTPIFLKGMDSAYIFLFQSYAPHLPAPPVVLSLHIIVSTIILAIPTVLMGTTLPILASLVARNARFTGWETGILYSVNTFGALAGAGATGFFFIRLWGVYPANFIGAGLNIGIALVCIILSRVSPGGSNEIMPVEVLDADRFRKKGLSAAVFGWLFIMGFVALGYEIVWVRTVVHILKAEIYTFSSVLCVYLFGYAAGIFAGGRLAKKTSGQLNLFVIAAPLVGLCGILYLPSLTRILDSRILWNYPLLKSLLNIFGYLPHLYLSMLFFFVPSFCMGVCFPLLVQVVRNLSGGTGDAVSKAYGINTLGCVLGSVGTGFFFIPFFGVQNSMLLLGLLAAACGFTAIFFIKKGMTTATGSVLPAICLAVVFSQPKDLFPKWINKCEGKGTYEVKLLDFVEGKNTTASVHQYADGSRVISTAGINVAGDALALRQTQKFQGHFPVIMHGGAQSVLTVGFGSGELTRLLTYHDIPDITCVEISPEMVRLSRRYFSNINLGADLEKHVRMVYMDAKNFMHLTTKNFDVIENDCIWPGTFAESSSLYTKEYFLDARRRLNDKGIFSTWLALDLPETTLFSIIKTFGEVFDNTLFIYPHYAPDRHILLMGQKIGHAYNYVDAWKEFEKEKVKESLAFIGVHDINDLLGSILADYSSLRAVAGSAPVNSDYFPFVEFDMNRAHLIDDQAIIWKCLGTIVRNTRRVDYTRLFSFAGLDEPERSGTLGALGKDQEGIEYLLESFCIHTPGERLQLIDKGLTIAPANRDLLRMRRMLTGERQ